MTGSNLLFLDPDNGLQPQKFSPERKKAIKCASFADLAVLKGPKRALVIYHHHTRRAGGHTNEIGYNADRLREKGFARVDAIRSRRYSPRVFFLLNSSAELRYRAKTFAAKWGKNGITWYEEPKE